MWRRLLKGVLSRGSAKCWDGLYAGNADRSCIGVERGACAPYYNLAAIKDRPTFSVSRIYGYDLPPIHFSIASNAPRRRSQG